jgi:hypothetical protein
MVTEILKVDESTIFAVPPENCVAETLEKAKAKGSGTVPKGLVGAGWLSAGTSGEAIAPVNQCSKIGGTCDVSAYLRGRCRVRSPARS